MDLGAGPPARRGALAAAAAPPLVVVAGGDVHLVQGRGQPRGQHARAAGVHVEAILVAHDGLVHAALVALALVVRLLRRDGVDEMRLEKIWIDRSMKQFLCRKLCVCPEGSWRGLDRYSSDIRGFNYIVVVVVVVVGASVLYVYIHMCIFSIHIYIYILVYCHKDYNIILHLFL